ncbi:hyalin-like [Patiria miniata]|uniref:HYR domain-containing protein n=1 Tax=Patiria miniata TaxID=46514 RepID=A0A913ZQX1_PATMI|nr:hyalin-like [Patiria miniata]
MGEVEVVFPAVTSTDPYFNRFTVTICDVDPLVSSGGVMWRVGENSTFPPPMNSNEQTVHYIATDDAGNQATCAWTFEVIDNESPVFDNCENVTLYTDPDKNYTSAIPSAPTASDNIAATVECSAIPNQLEIGVHQVSCIANDSASNTAMCEFEIYVVDIKNPVISCPRSRSFPTDPGQPNATVVFPYDYVASDNSGEFQVIVTELSPNSSEPNGMTWTVGDAVVLGIGNHTFFYLVTDAAGNEDYCAWDVEVYDNQTPLLQCPTDVEESTIDGSDMGMASWSLATVTDNSGVVSTPVASHTSGQMFTIGVHTVEFTAMDPHPDDNLGRCNFTVTITDNQAPVISCPPNGSFPTDPGQPNATVMFPNDYVASDNSGDFQVIVTELSPNSSEPNGMTWTVGDAVVLGIGDHTFFYLVTDATGNEDYCAWDVEVYDNQPPLLQCPTDVEESTIDGSDMGMASWSLATVTDNSGVVSTPVASHTSGQMFTIGVHTVEFTAMDPHPDGNLGRCNFTVTITDNQAPVISCPPNGSFPTDPGQPNATVMFPNDYVASDNSGDFQVIVTELSPNSSEPNGMTWTVGDAVVLGIGDHTFFYLVTDATGNEDYCAWDVEVYDNQPPLLQCPTDVEESTIDGSDMGMASWSLATVTDNSGVVSTPVASHTSGQMFTIGVHTVEFTAMDPHPDGNLGRCNFTVTITDNQAPVISCPPNGSFPTDPGQPNATVMFPNDYVASDNSGDFQVIVTELSPNSSEPNGMTWTVGDAVVLGIGDHTFFYLVTDATGNEDYCAWDVEVYDNQPPLLQCPTDVEESTIDGSDMGMASWSLATVTDNSGVVSTPVASHTSGQMFTIGVHTVEFTAMDPHPDGNLGRCNFTVTITDNQAPVISCPPNGSFPTDPGQPNATVMFPNDYVASDNSGDFQVIVTELSPNSSEPNGMTWTVGDAVVLGIGDHNFFYLVTDATGNEDYCAWDVEVYDNQPPLLQCPTDVEESTIDGSDMGMASWSLATVTDNSGVVSTPVASHTSGQMFTIGVHTVEFTAMDPHPDGNLGRCNFTVTITDNQAPVISCPPNGSFPTDPGQPNATVMFPNDYVASDNSGDFQVIVTELSPNSSEPNGMTWTVGDAVVLGIGDHTFFYLVTDATGNEDYCAWDVEVYDNQPPLLQCPTDVEESTIDGSDMGMASWSLATVTDNSGVVSTPVASHTSGQMFTIGVHTVEFTAMDPHPDGNLGRCNFTVTITDNQAPVISCPPNGSFPTDPGQPNATVMFPNDYVASDNSGDFQVIVTELSPNSSEPNGMTWTVGDAVVLGIGDHTFFYLVTDATGNEDYCAWDVEVYDNQPPLLQCPTDVEESTIDGSDMGMASWSLATVTDNSGVVSTPVASHTSGQMFTIGVHTVEFTAMDPHPDGNLGRCNFTVTITDNQAPVISCPPNGSFPTDPGQPNATVMFPNDYVASDNSGDFQVIVTELSPISSEPNGMTWTVGDAVVLGIGDHTFFYLVTDATGNEDYCAWDVEVYATSTPKPSTTHEAEPNSDTTTTGSVSDGTSNGIITSTPNPISALEQTTSLEPFTVTETAQLTDECSPQNETSCSGDLTCIFLLGRHQCNCPFASGQSGDSEICIGKISFH